MSDAARVPASRVRRLRWWTNVGAAAIVLGATALAGGQGCSTSPTGTTNNNNNGSSGGGSGGGSGGASSGGGSTDGGVIVDESGVSHPCTGATDGIIVSKRIVRLTFNQIVNSIGALLDYVSIPSTDGGAPSNIETQLTTDFQLTDAEHRTFPPLTNLTEGSTIQGKVYSDSDLIAQETAQFVHDNYAAATKCANPTDDTCAQTWLATFAQAAFRRPLTMSESTALAQVYTNDKSLGGSVQEATQYEVYAIFSSPWFLYRTEIGTDTEDMNAHLSNGPLAPYEYANALSYFLTDAPPDSTLLMAASNNQLTSSSQAQAQATRIIATPGAQANLEAAMFSYFSIQSLEAVVIDNSVYPNFTPQLRNSMRHEVELFLHDRLWAGSAGDILTSTQSRINQNLATLYGITPFPQAGQTPDKDGFALTQLPQNQRSGILTQAGFLTSKARPMAPSIIARGLIVNASFLCAENPGAPTDSATLAQVAAQSGNTMLTDRQKADIRAMTAPCNSCHPHFDPYGEALGAYDTIGEYKPTDSTGTINTSATLPAVAGGQMVTGPIDMGQDLATGTGFAGCMSKNLTAYALADAVTGGTVESCAIQQIAVGSTGSFTSVLSQIASSSTFTQRLGGM